MFYYISSLILNLSPWGYCLFSSSVEKTRRSPFLGLVFFLLLAMGTWPADSAHPANVGLQWDASTDPNVSAYKIYFGKTSRSYGYPVDVGSTTGCTISGLEDGATYYFAATAVDTAGDESGYSNEAIYTTPGGCTPSLSPANQSFGASGGSGSVTLTTGAGCAWTALSNALCNPPHLQQRWYRALRSPLFGLRQFIIISPQRDSYRRRPDFHHQPVGRGLRLFDLPRQSFHRRGGVKRNGFCDCGVRMCLERLQRCRLDLDKFREQRKRKRGLRVLD